MAIISCPNCGKQITDRMEICPHCYTVLLKPKEASNMTKDTIKMVLKCGGNFAKNRIILVLFATFFTILTCSIWCAFAIRLAIPMGELARNSVDHAKSLFFYMPMPYSTFKLLILEAALLCILPILLKEKATLQRVVGIAATVLFGIIGFFVQHHATLTLRGITPEEMSYCLSLSLGFGSAFPMLLGSLLLLRSESKLKKSVAIQIGLCAIFIVLSVVLGYLMVNLLAMGMNSLSIGNLIAAVAVLVLAVLISGGFRHLTTPQK